MAPRALLPAGCAGGWLHSPLLPLREGAHADETGRLRFHGPLLLASRLLLPAHAPARRSLHTVRFLCAARVAPAAEAAEAAESEWLQGLQAQTRRNGSKGFRRRRVGGAWEVGRRGPLPLRPLRLQPRLQRRLPRKLRRTRALRAMGDDRRGCRASPRRGGAASAARGTSVDADAPALPLFLWAQASPPRPFWPQRPRPRPRPPFWPAPCPPQRASRQRASRLRGVCGSRGEGRGVSV